MVLKMENQKKIHLYLPNELKRKLDRFIDGKRFRNRSELLRYIIEIYTDESKWVGKSSSESAEKICTNCGMSESEVYYADDPVANQWYGELCGSCWLDRLETAVKKNQR
jgi:Arc/MetJ-type ribon-helix-helix transcriptional regulator